MTKYVDLLRRNRTIFRLNIMEFLGYFAAWFTSVALFTLFSNLNASVFMVSTLAALHFFPVVFLSPINGVIIDKIKPKKLLISLIIIELIATFFMIFIDSYELLFLIFILLFIKMAAASIHFQTEMTIIAKKLNEDDLKLANEIQSIIWSLAYILGMALSGIFVTFYGVTNAIIVDVLLFCIILIISFKLDLNDVKIDELEENILNSIKYGLIYIKQNKKVLHLIFLHSIIGLSAYEALVALLAEYKYKEILSISLAIGLINAIRAVGLTIGQLILSKYANKQSLFYIFLFQSFGIFLWSFLQENFYISMIGIILTGFFTTTLWSFTFTTLQQATDKKYLGRVLSYNDSIFMSIATTTSFFIGLLFEKGLNLQSITFLIGIGFFISAFYWKWIANRYL
ncbi:MAG: MFS transporter [Campylobacterales bacterium]|nr:MFS transporter [Campylobacterales bacterium]